MEKPSSAGQQLLKHTFQRHRPDTHFQQSNSQTPTHQEFQQFLEQSSSTFDLTPVNRELVQLENPSWAREFEHHQVPVHPPEFEAIYAKAQQSQPWADEFQQYQPPEFVNQHYAKNLDHIDWNAEFEKYKGKEPMHTNWTEEFQSVQQEKMDTLAGDTTDWQQQFQEIWSQLQESKRAEGDWASEFRDIFPADMEPEAAELDPVLAPCEPYIFETVNEFLNHSNPFEDGMEILRNQGSLSLAALAFEAAVQRDPQNSEAWMHLGRIQAENEKEIPAIAALQRAVQENPKNLEALMNLSVSYTNEGQTHQAYATLERWFNTRYPDIPMHPLSRSERMHDRLVSSFLKVVMKDTTHVDPNLQIGLGLLYYNETDYQKTIDCFTAALSTRLDDYQLWNRLGATLSNSDEEAIDAYRRALELKPGFVRARYNLGVSCMNIGCYREAAEHFLSALSLHQVNSEHINISKTLWDTLYRTFVLVLLINEMERRDLAQQAMEHCDLTLFKKDFDF